MLPFKLIYHPGYDLRLGSHVFPSQKYRLVRERLLADGSADSTDFEEPEPASDDQIRFVHEAGWIQRLKNDTLGCAERLRLEIPWSRGVARACWLAVGGSIAAARNALRDGVGCNLGGGFHHAFQDHGEGFCALNDIAIAIRTLQHDGLIDRAMVVDCDVHQGNGTASIFTADSSAATLSIHQTALYPKEKPPSTVDIDLPDATGDEEYLECLRVPCERLIESFQPQLLFFVAGADPYCQDQLGGLSLSIEGLQRRDRLVFEMASSRQIPVAVVFAGGYAVQVLDTVTIHCNTVKAAEQVYRIQWKG